MKARLMQKTDIQHSAIPNAKTTCCGDTNDSAASVSSCSTKRFDYLLWLSFAGCSALFVLPYFFPQIVTAHPWLGIMSATTHEMAHAMWWGVMMGIVAVGFLEKIPRAFTMCLLGPGGTFSGLLRATGAGVLFDLCSHGILMVGAKLYERGASIGQVVAFLLASPWNSLSLTLVLIGLIGLKWTVAFIILSTLVGIASGWIFDQLVGKKILPPNSNQTDLAEDFEFWPEAKKQFRIAAFDLAFFRDVAITGIRSSRIIIRWLLFGILLAALLRAVIDPTQYQYYFGATLFGLATTIILATLIEVCSEGSTPIASDLLNQARAPGNSFAFLMSGVSTDYTEIMVIKETTASWKIALFVPLVTLPQITLIAIIINSFQGTS